MSISQYVPPSQPQRSSAPRRDFNAMLPEQYRTPPPKPPMGMDDYVSRYFATHDPTTHLPIGPGALPTHVPFADVPRGAQPEFGPTTGFVAPKRLDPSMSQADRDQLDQQYMQQWLAGREAYQQQKTLPQEGVAKPPVVSETISTGRLVPDDATVRAQQFAALQSLVPRSR